MRVLVLLALLVPSAAFAQGADIGISGVALLSIQPVDDTYIGAPYLNEGLGGVAPGFGGAVSAIWPSKLVIEAEFTTARFTAEQVGRVVSGCSGTSPCVPHHTTLHDSMLTGLVGYAQLNGPTRVIWLAGIGTLLDSATLDGESIGTLSGESWLALTGGVDIVRSIGDRAALVFGGRYSFVDRQGPALGIGRDIVRVAGGVRIRLN
jgi:hypothetical protein